LSAARQTRRRLKRSRDLPDGPPEEGVVVPWAADDEHAVISLMLAGDRDVVALARERIVLDDFFRPRERRIVEAVYRTVDAGHDPNAVAVARELPDERDLIFSLLDFPALRSEAASYVDAVHAAGIKRRLLNLGPRIVEEVADSNGDMLSLMASIESLTAESLEAERGSCVAVSPTITAAALYEAESVELDMLLDPFLPLRALCLLAGANKMSGKSTWAYHLTRAALTGGTFLDSPVRQTPVLLLTEEGRRTLRHNLQRAGVPASEDLHILFRHETSLEVEELRGALLELIHRHRIGLVIVDTVGAWGDVEDENDAAQMRRAIDFWRGLSEEGPCVLLLAHARKSGGDGTDIVRGSSASPGAVDVVLVLLRSGRGHPNRRELRSFGRIEQLPEAVEIELEEDGEHREYHMLGDCAVRRRVDRRQKVLALLPTERQQAMTAEAVVDAVNADGDGPGRSTVFDILHELVRDGLVNREKGADPGHPRAQAHWRVAP